MTTGRDMTLNARDERVLAVPLNRHLGLTFDGRDGGVAYAHFVVAPELVAFSVLHGGAMYAVFDVMGLLASRRSSPTTSTRPRTICTRR